MSAQLRHVRRMVIGRRGNAVVCACIVMAPIFIGHASFGDDVAKAQSTSAASHGDGINPYAGGNPATPANAIDDAVGRQLTRLRLIPANDCSDATFLRRAYLDVIGTIPTAEEARAFLEDRRATKRGILIDELLEREEYSQYWALKWGDLLRVKSEFPINLWPNAVQAYSQWIRVSLKQNVPYDRFARELLTTSGSNFRDGPVNFYRAVQSKEPTALAQAVALTLMGVRADQWPPARLQEMAVFFSQIGYKSTGEWKEEIVIYDPEKAPHDIIIATLPDGTNIQLAPGKDPRKAFADWLISPSNPWFTRNIANRVWSWFFGRGIIQEPDDIRPDNPPVNAELLAVMERELVANHYDLKALSRLILNSRTYQLSCEPRSDDPTAAANFAFYPVRRLEAEVMIDAINEITGSTEQYISAIPEPYTFVPSEQRTIALVDASISSPFLDLFGRSPRDTGLESERINRPTGFQSLHMLNSSHIQRKLEQSERLRALGQGKPRPREVVDMLYLTILSRYPTAEEAKVVSEYRQASAANRRFTLDVAWALLNTAEFQYRH